MPKDYWILNKGNTNEILETKRAEKINKYMNHNKGQLVN